MIRVFPRRTKWTPIDDLAFVGDPPLFRPPEQPVKISVCFTWDILEGERLLKAWKIYYPDIEMGGPALGDPGGDFTPGRFVKEGVIETSRGCIKNCYWCFVPIREGKIRELPIKEGNIVIDNNLLACSKEHIGKVFDMLRNQKKAAQFKGGLDASLFQAWHKDLMDSIRVAEMFFACDTRESLPSLERVANILHGISIEKKRCFVLIGRGSLEECEDRLQRVYTLGFLPFAQLYQPAYRIEYNHIWKALHRKWSRPAAYRSRKGS